MAWKQLDDRIRDHPSSRGANLEVELAADGVGIGVDVAVVVNVEGEGHTPRGTAGRLTPLIRKYASKLGFLGALFTCNTFGSLDPFRNGMV